jgi:hypothetical protein
MIPDLKLYYRTITIKKAWYCHKNRHKEKYRIEDPEIKLCSCRQLIFGKVAQNTWWRHGSSTNDAGKTGYPYIED